MNILPCTEHLPEESLGAQDIPFGDSFVSHKRTRGSERKQMVNEKLRDLTERAPVRYPLHMGKKLHQGECRDFAVSACSPKLFSDSP